MTTGYMSLSARPRWIEHRCDRCKKVWKMRVTARPEHYVCPDCRGR